MIEKPDSINLALATTAILGQAPRSYYGSILPTFVQNSLGKKGDALNTATYFDNVGLRVYLPTSQARGGCMRRADVAASWRGGGRRVGYVFQSSCKSILCKENSTCRNSFAISAAFHSMPETFRTRGYRMDIVGPVIRYCSTSQSERSLAGGRQRIGAALGKPGPALTPATANHQIQA